MFTTVKSAKDHARRLFTALKTSGQPVPLSRAYELTAQAAGHADWNTMAAKLHSKTPLGWSLGQSVQGAYLGHPIRGHIHALQRQGPTHVVVEIDLETPVDVSGSTLFSALRKRVRATLDATGKSVGRRSDGVPHLILT